jgi:hypothetical protein
LSEPLRVLSLGAGVQSSTLLLMAVRGEVERPDHAIFADTQWEPKAVYEWLAFLEGEAVGVIPIHRVTAGDIRAACLDRSKRNAQPPFYVKSNTSESETMIRRQCTKGYKIEPIQKKLRELLGLIPRQRAPKTVAVEQWMGISLDEAIRMKDSQIPWIKHRYPLIEMGMTRRACLSWMERNGYARPPKSACIGCPYTDNARWRDMKANAPDEWADAVAFDASLRSIGVRGINGEPYLHRSLVPLGEVDLRTAEDLGQGRLFTDAFNNECEGMCGV